MKLRVLSIAELEIVEGANWYEDQAEGKGSQFLDEVSDAAAQIRRNPLRFGRLELGNVQREFR